jgi:hypothetical protein
MSTPNTLAAACCTPRLSVPNTVACTVSSAAHGAMNACARWNTSTARIHATTAATTVFPTCDALAHVTGSCSR